MLLVSPVIEVFRYGLQPIPPFSWINLRISTLDIVATIRLCVALRQIREQLYLQHVHTKGLHNIEERSFLKNILTTLMVVYGGEAVTVPTLYTTIQAVIDVLPAVPVPSATLELPLSIVDGFTRAYLLCNLIPPPVTTHTSPTIATSPWTLLLSSLINANGGFFCTNIFCFLNPTPLAVQTPPELQPYGWSTADLWCAPLITGLYALLTHAQPFWADAHELLARASESASLKPTVEPVDPETARAVCAMLLITLFVARTAKNFRLWRSFEKVQAKVGTESAKANGKAKTQ